MAQEPVPRLTASAIPAEEVRAEMERILASHEFRSSKRSEEFLRYVVENTLNGQTGILRERTIGIEVFGRPTSYDPSDDATVRVKAGEVRKRLGLYYAGAGRDNRLRIELPAGTYVPEFRQTTPVPEVTNNTAALSAAAPQSAIVPKRVRWFGKYRALWIVSAGTVVMALAAALLLPRPGLPTILDQFWGPVLQSTAPISICAAFVPDVYARNREAEQRAARPTDFVLIPDQFVGGGDLIAISRLSALLTRLNRAYRVRIGSEVSLHDFEAGPAILVGYSYTRWSEISKDLRFFIDSSRRPIAVMDNGAPTEWSLPDLTTEQHATEDYAIVTRVVHPYTHAPLVELAGIRQYGTDAAAALVTNPDILAEALRGAPAGWQKKNLQLVLHVKVISGSPTAPKVLAIHVW